MTGYSVWTFTFLSVIANGILGQIPNGIQSPRCKAPVTAPQKIEKVIALCQEEIKLAILKDAPVKLTPEDKIKILNSSEIFSDPEALDILGETTKDVVHVTTGHRSKRDLFSEEEKRIAGCLLQCVYRKVKAVDQDGNPTVDGLVRLYAEGVTERGYFIATAQAVQQCLYIGNQQKLATTKQGSIVCVKCEEAAMREHRKEAPRCPGHGIEGRTTRWEALSAPHCRGKWLRIERQLLDAKFDENVECELCAQGSQFIFV